MSRHANRFRELRQQRIKGLRRLKRALMNDDDEWETRSQVGQRVTMTSHPQVELAAPPPPEKWLTQEKAKTIAKVSFSIGCAIVGFLKAIGAI